MSMSYKGELAVLEIPKTEFNDGGWYRCEAVNKLGRVETQGTLVVQCMFIILKKIRTSIGS